jgi:hypothetical protein
MTQSHWLDVPFTQRARHAHDRAREERTHRLGARPRLHGHVRRQLWLNDDAEGIATIRAALDAGISLIDTGDFYGIGPP